MTDMYDEFNKQHEDTDVWMGEAAQERERITQQIEGEQQDAVLEEMRANPLQNMMPTQGMYNYNKAHMEGQSLKAPEPKPAPKPAAGAGEATAPVEPELPPDMQIQNKYFKPGAMVLGGMDLATGEQKLSTQKKKPGYMTDVFIGGALDAAKGMITLRSDIRDALGVFDPASFVGLADMLPEIEKSDDWKRQIPRALMQFVVPYAGASKVMRGLNSSKKLLFAKELAASGIATQGFDPEEGNLATVLKSYNVDETEFVKGLQEAGFPVKETLDLLDSEYQTMKNGRLAGRLSMLTEDTFLGMLIPAVALGGKKITTLGVDAYKGADFKAMEQEAVEAIRKSVSSLRSGADPTDFAHLLQLATAKVGQGMNDVETWMKSFQNDGFTKSDKTKAFVTAYKEKHGMLPGEESVQATHYSTKPGLEELSASRYGTGYKGQEAKRLTPDDERVYFYHGDYKKELPLGSEKYEWEQKGLYNFSKDPLGLSKIAKEQISAQGKTHYPSAERIVTRKEELIREYGYKGYKVDHKSPFHNAGITFGDVDLRPPIASRMPRVSKSGDYVGLPAGINTPEKFDIFYDRMMTYVDEGVGVGKDWYSKSSDAILRAAGGNVPMAKMLAKALAITSPSMNVKSNTGHALKAWYQKINGEPIHAGLFPNANRESLMQAFAGGPMKGGDKTTSFYQNMLEGIDEAALKEMGLVTNDMWVARAVGMAGETFSTAQYKAVKEVMNQMARDRGITPHQAQASLWTSIKGRYEATNADYVLQARAKGLLKKDGAVKKGMEKRAANLQRRIAIGSDAVSPEALAKAAYDYSDGFKDYFGQISLEAVPTTNSAWGQMLTDAPIEVRAEYTKEVYNQFLDENGVDIAAKALGIPQGGIVNGPGFWQGVSNPSIQLNVPMATKNTPLIDDLGKVVRTPKGKVVTTKELMPEVKQKMDEYAKFMADVMDQDGVGYHMPLPARNLTEANGIQFKVGQNLSHEQMTNLGDEVTKQLGDDVGLIATDQGVRLINFSDTPNKEFQKTVTKIMNDSDMFADIEISKFKSDGNLVDRAAEINYGKDYGPGLGGGGQPDVLGEIRDVLKAKVSEVNARFYEQYWGSQ